MRLLFFLTLLVLFSCSSSPGKRTEKKEAFKRYDYRIAVTTGNFFSHPEKFILNNLGIDTYEASDTGFKEIKPYTLYHISYSAKSQHNDTAQILFPKQNCDTLFTLVNLFFKGFSFDNVDTVGKEHDIINDDVHAFVELSFNGRKLIAHASSINNPEVGNEQLDSLLNYLYKFKVQ
ncbi:MAG: hypothetical protein ACXVBZ_07275 [Flavisolibacter sp.]